MAKFDYSNQELNELEAAQRNLNENLDNDDLYRTFKKTADDVAEHLSTKYGDGWSKPDANSSLDKKNPQQADLCSRPGDCST